MGKVLLKLHLNCKTFTIHNHMFGYDGEYSWKSTIVIEGIENASKMRINKHKDLS